MSLAAPGLLLPVLLYVPLFLASGVILCHVLPYYWDRPALKSYPGPWLAKFSRIWLGRVARGGERYKVIHQAHLKYGRFVRIAPDELSIADADAIQPVLGHGTGTTKSEFYDAFVSIHRGLFNTRDRADHTRKRKLVANTFSQQNVLEFEPYIASSITAFLNQWDRLCKLGVKESQGWHTFDCLPWLNFLAFDIIGDLAFGEPFGMIERGEDYAEVEPENGGKLLHLSAAKILNVRGEFSMAQGCLPSWMRRVTPYLDPWYARGAASVENLAGIARNRVKKRLEGGAQDRKDLLARLHEGKDANGNPMGRDELTAEALTQLIAGSDTTSNSSCAILWWIVKHPEVHRKLLDELNRRLGSSLGAVTFDECKDLEYLNACINEALRCHSTSSIGLPRIMATDVNFKGHLLKKGTIVSVPTYDIHHDPEVWGDPWTFRPERWLKPDSKELERAYMPFSFGPRSCVGRNVAILELKMIISTLILRYDFQLVDTNCDELETREGFLRKPLNFFVRIKRRV
ncbi:hypothetical protein CROQUDRAFT_51696 [Cronartium quercuum f. sp. fusiforme G11]|uniref:Cytochrome P450 n=1 Tax=Cronartium quercuum f. sp. fusiforme G11 TaxID=708437 RepID=A0A9P6N9D8_9BASI|nr:hypothetical protein CROQUDRAFT_51696 [Cronartium quercuum f. sp. fusiforme G11]